MRSPGAILMIFQRFSIPAAGRAEPRQGSARRPPGAFSPRPPGACRPIEPAYTPTEPYRAAPSGRAPRQREESSFVTLPFSEPPRGDFLCGEVFCRALVTDSALAAAMPPARWVHSVARERFKVSEHDAEPSTSWPGSRAGSRGWVVWNPYQSVVWCRLSFFVKGGAETCRVPEGIFRGPPFAR